MRRDITLSLSHFEAKQLEDCLDYLLSDDKEKNDFKEQYGDEWFDENDDLIISEVSESAKTHIYYKTIDLWNELMAV